jgi:hypothetical protein
METSALSNPLLTRVEEMLQLLLEEREAKVCLIDGQFGLENGGQLDDDY